MLQSSAHIAGVVGNVVAAGVVRRVFVGAAETKIGIRLFGHIRHCVSGHSFSLPATSFLAS